VGIFLILIDTQSLADEAAGKVKITYTDVKTPIITIQDAIDAKSFFSDEIVDQVFGDPDG
jgi:xanthine dehydrogenase/oxidase